MAAPVGNNENAGGLRWMPGHDEMLRKLVADGVGGTQIATEINREFLTAYSRNAVIGRAHRLGLGNTRPTRPATTGPKPPRRTKSGTRKSPLPIRTHGIKPLAPSRIPVPDNLRAADVVPRLIPLAELERGDCRWPYGNGPFHFCGHPASEGPYCWSHFRLAVRQAVA